MNNTSEAPQDSVLRRHWEAARQQQSGSVQPPASSSAESTDSAPSGGFFSWLKSLFS